MQRAERVAPFDAVAQKVNFGFRPAAPGLFCHPSHAQHAGPPFEPTDLAIQFPRQPFQFRFGLAVGTFDCRVNPFGGFLPAMRHPTGNPQPQRPGFPLDRVFTTLRQSRLRGGQTALGPRRFERIYFPVLPESFHRARFTRHDSVSSKCRA